jgi:hypothetical protein
LGYSNKNINFKELSKDNDLVNMANLDNKSEVGKQYFIMDVVDLI